MEHTNVMKKQKLYNWHAVPQMIILFYAQKKLLEKINTLDKKKLLN